MRSKYALLQAHLESRNGEVEMTFAEVAELVSGLPGSAYRHRAWWSNEQDGRHVQAHAWADAGKRVTWVDLATERVRFS